MNHLQIIYKLEERYKKYCRTCAKKKRNDCDVEYTTEERNRDIKRVKDNSSEIDEYFGCYEPITKTK